MTPVEELDNVEPAFVEIEVDVPRLKVRSTCFPYECFGVQPFDFLPSSTADAPAVDLRIDKQKFQLVMLRFFIDLQNKTADDPPVLTDSISRTAVDAVLDRPAGNDLAIFLKMIVPHPELLHRAVPECALVVENELFPVIV
jgi:hypothetical protein